MLVRDVTFKMEFDFDKWYLIDLIRARDRQVNLYFTEEKTDEHGFIHWNMENWVFDSGHQRFIRSYGNDGVWRREFSGYNVYDMDKYFMPELADRVELA